MVPFVASLETNPPPKIEATLSTDGSIFTVMAEFTGAQEYASPISAHETATAPKVTMAFRINTEQGGYDLYTTSFEIKNQTFNLSPSQSQSGFVHSCSESIPFECSSLVLQDTSNAQLTIADLVVNVFGTPADFTADKKNVCSASGECPKKKEKTGLGTGAVAGLTAAVVVVLMLGVFFIMGKFKNKPYTSISD
jgi:hypothetical protein